MNTKYLVPGQGGRLIVESGRKRRLGSPTSQSVPPPPTSSCEIISTLHSTLIQLLWRFILENIFKLWEGKNPFLLSVFKYFWLFSRNVARVWSDAFIPKLSQLSEAEPDQGDPWDHCQLKMWSRVEYFHPNIRTRIIRLINGSSTASPDRTQAQLLNKFG